MASLTIKTNLDQVLTSLGHDFKTIFDKTKNDDGWGYVRNEIIDRISELTVECPECESIMMEKK